MVATTGSEGAAATTGSGAATTGSGAATVSTGAVEVVVEDFLALRAEVDLRGLVDLDGRL